MYISSKYQNRRLELNIIAVRFFKIQIGMTQHLIKIALQII